MKKEIKTSKEKKSKSTSKKVQKKVAEKNKTVVKKKPVIKKDVKKTAKTKNVKVVPNEVDFLKEELAHEKKANKVLSIIMVVCAIFCLTTAIAAYANKPATLDVENVSLNYRDIIADEDVKNITQALDVDIEQFMGTSLIGVGLEKPDIDLVSHTGENVNLAKTDGIVVLEVVADWCNYCQEETATHFREIIGSNPNVTFYQYMFTGGEEQVNEFYASAGAEIPEGLKVLYANDKMEKWLDDAGVESLPTFIIFNENGKVCGSTVGINDAQEFADTARYMLANPLYELTSTKNEPVYVSVKKIRVAFQYMDELKNIDVPNKYLEEHLK